VIYSGLDWSGSPGHEPHDPLLVFAVPHIDESDLRRLAAGLATAKQRLHVAETYVFRHVGASAAAHRAFYEVLVDLPIDIHVHVVEKPRWTAEFVKRTSGPDRICDCVVTIIVGCPDRVVANQKLLVDLRRQDMAFVRALRKSLSRALLGIGRKTFENVQPCPDHRIEGGIVQVADMIAGEIREQGALRGPYLEALGARIQSV
jgi:hypothetical protein